MSLQGLYEEHFCFVIKRFSLDFKWANERYFDFSWNIIDTDNFDLDLSMYKGFICEISNS